MKWINYATTALQHVADVRERGVATAAQATYAAQAAYSATGTMPRQGESDERALSRLADTARLCGWHQNEAILRLAYRVVRTRVDWQDAMRGVEESLA